MNLLARTLTRVFRFTPALFKSRQTFRAILVVALVAGVAVALGSPSSAGSVAQLFTRAASLFGRKPNAVTTKAAPSNVATIATAPQSPSSSMIVERRGHTATRLADGRVLIAGGENSSGSLNQAEIYDAAAATFSTTGNMGAARADHTATLLSDGRVLLAGGHDSTGALATTEIFDPTTGAFDA